MRGEIPTYTGFRQMLFKDSLYNVPAETDKYLSAHYGSTFMQPDPNFSESEASNIKYYSLKRKKALLLFIVIYNYHVRKIGFCHYSML